MAFVHGAAFGLLPSSGPHDSSVYADLERGYRRDADSDLVDEQQATFRTLGLDSAMALVVGEVIGVGIFLTPSEMTKALGSPFWGMSR